MIDRVISHAITNDLDYVSNTLIPTFPDGMDTEVFKFSALEKAMNEAKLPSELEHVTTYIWKNSSFKGGSLFSSDCVTNEVDYSAYRLTVDRIQDFMVIQELVKLIGTKDPWINYVKALDNNSELKQLNNRFKRNEGLEKSEKQDKRN